MNLIWKAERIPAISGTFHKGTQLIFLLLSCKFAKICQALQTLTQFDNLLALVELEGTEFPPLCPRHTVLLAQTPQ